jgi:hypothetical protein
LKTDAHKLNLLNDFERDVFEQICKFKNFLHI